MKDNFDENLMRRYLLGELAESEQVEIEDRVFTDPDTRAMLDAAENDLIDEYAANYLTGAEREQFETMFFNSAPRREKIEFARTLSQISSETAQTAPQKSVENRQSWRTRLFNFSLVPQFAFAAVALFAVGAGAWYLFLRPAPTTEIVRQNGNRNIAETSTPAIQSSPSPTPIIPPTLIPKTNSNIGNVSETNKNADKNTNRVLPPLQSAPTLATLVFPAGLTRAGNAPKLGLTLAGSVKNARLVFNLEKGDEFPAYQITVVAQTGANVAQSRRSRRNQTVVLEIPAAKLPAGIYTATLRGINSAPAEPETIGYYDFSVSRP